jgi:perosamine synthetase
MLSIDRDGFIRDLQRKGVACSVHWRPLHLHPYYQETFGWRPEDLPAASGVWPRLVSLPLFSCMRRDEVNAVAEAVRAVCAGAARPRLMRTV